jgi:Zn-dependent protease with chaperone function
MSGALRLVALNAAGLLAFGAVAVSGAALAHRAVMRWSRSLAPASRARVLLAWAAVPAGLPVLLLLVALSPSIGAALGVTVDHCPEHVGHVHLCLHHLPASGPALVGGVALAAAVSGLVAAVAHGVRLAALTARLARTPASSTHRGVGLVRSSRAFAFTAGWLRPRILVSTTLADRLTSEQLEIVLAHERAHATRGDAVLVTAARVLSLAHLPFVRRELLAALTLACEQACDEAAAACCGDRVRVAETLVVAARAAARPPHDAIGLAFGDGDVAERVESLLDAPRRSGVPPAAAWLLVAAAGALALGAAHVHHWTETLLHHLLH